MQTKPPQQKTILLVDDDNQIHDLFSRTLTRAGFRVIEARDGQEGYRAAKKELPDIILLDIQMPVLDGIGMLAKIKEHRNTASIPVILLTAFEDSPEHITAAKNFGATDFFTKGTPLSDILQRIQNLLL